jgi:hypothetical protein
MTDKPIDSFTTTEVAGGLTDTAGVLAETTRFPGVYIREPGQQLRAEAEAAGIDPQPGEPTTGFGAHEQEVIGSPRVFNIFWGRSWGSPTTGMNTRMPPAWTTSCPCWSTAATWT